MEHYCKSCGHSLGGDEIALYRKLVYRGAREYQCINCLAKDLASPREKLESLIEYYHRTGICTLFAKY